MLSFKFKRLCSQVVASLSALGVFSISGNADAATAVPGETFLLSVPKGMTLSADYAQASCPTRPNSSVESTDTACIYTCNDGYAVSKYAVDVANAVAGGETGAATGDSGLAMFWSSGIAYFIKSFSFVGQDDVLPDGFCVPLMTGISGVTGVGVSGISFGFILGEVTDDMGTNASDYTGMGYVTFGATGACKAGYSASDMSSETGATLEGYNGQYKLKVFAAYENETFLFPNTIQCYPIPYAMIFDCGSGNTAVYDSSNSSGDGQISCDAYGTSRCAAKLVFGESGKINVTCTQDGYRLKGWTYSTDE